MVWERYCNASPKPELFVFSLFIFSLISRLIWVRLGWNCHRWISIQKQVNWCTIDPFSLKFCTSQHSYPVPLTNHIVYKFWEFIVVRSSNNNTLKNHTKHYTEQGWWHRRITNSGYMAFSLQYHLLNKFLWIKFMLAFLFCSLPWAANVCILMMSCYVIILVQSNLLWMLKTTVNFSS